MKQEMNDRDFFRGLKTRHLQLISLGGIIGSGYFLGTGYVVSQAGPSSCLAYLLGGLIVICVMFCLGELAVAKPISGSFITYAKEYISPAWACGVGWCYWVTWVSYVPSEMIAGGLIMNSYFPDVSAMWWAVLFGLIVTIINLANVRFFGEMEFWLALVKILALIGFVVMAGFIFTGIIGTKGFIGTNYLLGNGGFTPKGYSAILLTMVIILVNFQGSEIIGLAAGESKRPEKSIPIAVKNVTWRIILLYLIPMLMLVTIYPWEKASVSKSVFVDALSFYGFNWAGGVFSFVILTAAISCSNSGLYGCSRALHALAREGMAPSCLKELNPQGIPQNATLISIVGCWLGIFVYTIDSSETVYTYLLALSGFTGALAWISICWSQLNFRKQLIAEHVTSDVLKFKVPFFPYLTHFGIWTQVICLVLVLFTEELRNSLYFGVPLLIIPIIWYKLSEMKQKATVVN